MIATGLQLAAAFNLVCTVTFDRFPDQRAQSVIMRVDLASGRFCLTHCPHVLPIQSVTARRVVFQDRWLEGNFTFVRRTYDRKTGRYLVFLRTNFGTEVVENIGRGKCRVAPFSGFEKSPGLETT
jgi:hypothetical protein